MHVCRQLTGNENKCCWMLPQCKWEEKMTDRDRHLQCSNAVRLIFLVDQRARAEVETWREADTCEQENLNSNLQQLVPDPLFFRSAPRLFSCLCWLSFSALNWLFGLAVRLRWLDCCEAVAKSESWPCSPHPPSFPFFFFFACPSSLVTLQCRYLSFSADKKPVRMYLFVHTFLSIQTSLFYPFPCSDEASSSHNLMHAWGEHVLISCHCGGVIGINLVPE